MIKQTSQQKGFTLIELLVVIAIVAILAVVVILTLNPAELLRQARDSNRLQDMNTVKAGIAQYLADVSSGISIGASATCYMSATTTSANCGFAGTYGTATGSTSRAVDGTGWIPVDFTDISSGAPFGQLPIDPSNTSPYIYRYVASTTALTFKLMAPLESTKYTATGGAAASDGGASSTAYETGTNMSL